jgi:NAD(P)H dehydrogenase (quinone)
MIEGFNAGWIDFADRGAHARKGSIGIEEAVTTLIQRQHA